MKKRAFALTKLFLKHKHEIEKSDGVPPRPQGARGNKTLKDLYTRKNKTYCPNVLTTLLKEILRANALRMTGAAHDESLPRPTGERICGRTNEVSPDSEQIEQTVAKATIAKLCERGTNSRRGLGEGATEDEILRVAQNDEKISTAMANDKTQSNVKNLATYRPNVLTTFNTSHVSQKKRAKRKAAFTLAEVLITLGIIGVVAAMTLPVLTAKYKVKVIVTSMKKNYSVLAQAFFRAVAENGNLSSWGELGRDKNTAELVAEKIKPFLKVIDDCGTGV